MIKQVAKKGNTINHFITILHNDTRMLGAKIGISF